MLERIQIQDFQRHEKLRIKLDPKITTIVGPSDSGKSSILRAIRWVFLNRPRGNGFIREGQSSTSVSLWVDDRKVKRIRSKTKNQYKLDDATMNAVATTVPEPIADFLNVDDVNFHLQHESPFWFGLSPGEVAKRINSIVDLELVDSTLYALTGALRKSGVAVEIANERWENSSREAKELDYVPEIDANLKTVENQQKEVSSLRGQASLLGASISEAIIYQERTETLSGAILGASGALESGREWKRLFEERDGLAKLLEKAKEAEQRVSQPIPDISELGVLKEQAEKLNTDFVQLHQLVMEIEDSESDVRELRGKVGEAEETLENESDGVCPLCGSKI